MPLQITKGVKLGKPRTAGKKTNWPMVRQNYLRENLVPGRLTGMSIYTFITTYNLDARQTLERAKAEGWETAVKELRDELAVQAQRALMDVALHTEIEIRHKQARYAAMAINKATLKLMTVNPEDLSVKDAIRLLQVGLTEERKAYGMVESVSIVKTEDAPKQQRTTAANQALAILERRREMASMDVLDVESTPVAADQHAG